MARRITTISQKHKKGGIDMKFITKASLIPTAKNIDKRFIIPTILANRLPHLFFGNG